MVVPVLLSLTLPTALAASSASTPFQPATAGYQYTFPRDHGSHARYRTEWWYYTGHLHSKSGRSFGFELTFFRRGVPPDDIKTLPSKWSISHLYL
ncbi:MAG: lipocalin-like domain-containing protein, partial [Nitrospira sp.]